LKEYLTSRFKAVLIDYFCIIIYLIMLFVISMGLYFYVNDEVPNYTEASLHVISFFTTFLPVVLYYSIIEGLYSYQSFGKKLMKLQVKYKSHPIRSSFIRNIIKFLPWQIAHIAIIIGAYHGYDLIVVNILLIIASLLPVLYILMIIFNHNHRSLGDILANADVVVVDNNTSDNNNI